MVTSSSVNFLPAGSLSPVTPPQTPAPVLSALICPLPLPGGGSELSSESARIDIVTSRLLNWTWSKINLLTNALPGYFWWNMLLQNVCVSAWASWEMFLVLQVCAERQKAKESRPWFSQTQWQSQSWLLSKTVYGACLLFAHSSQFLPVQEGAVLPPLPRHSGDMWPPRRWWTQRPCCFLVACTERFIIILGDVRRTEGWMATDRPLQKQARRLPKAQVSILVKCQMEEV